MIKRAFPSPACRRAMTLAVTGSFSHARHTYADNGVYMVQVTVVDDDGGTDTKTFQVTVANVAPMLTVIDDQSTSEGARVLSLVDLGRFTDPGFGPGETFPTRSTGATAAAVSSGPRRLTCRARRRAYRPARSTARTPTPTTASTP